MPDPTLEEMRTHLRTVPQDEPDSDSAEFDQEEAIYWFANDYHGGQWSNLYSALCQSEYHPGPLTNGPELDSMGAYLYDELVAAYTHN